MTLRKFSIALSLAAATTLPLLAQVTPIGRSTPTPAAQDVALGAYSDAEASVISTRLYRALLGREPDAGGLSGTMADVRAGRGRQRIDEMVGSSEFASHTNPLSAEAMLEQIYRGLLGRSVDPAGVSGRLQSIRERRYTEQVVSIIQSEEFRGQLASAVSSVSSKPADSAASVATSSAINCQENVVEAIRNDLTGFVLITFDNAAMSGSATDVSDGGRRLSYRCDPSSTASYNYDDGRRARSAPSEANFTNDIVRSCQGEIATKAKQQFRAANIIFESAGLMPSDNGTQAVRGLGFQRSAAGRNGANFVYACDMRGTQILASTVRHR